MIRSLLPCNYDVVTLWFVNRIVFTWDDRKAAANLRKHGVSFDEAMTVFSDESARLAQDPDADVEQRLILLGLSAQMRVLVVVHSYRDADSIIRIISARKGTARERAIYTARR